MDRLTQRNLRQEIKFAIFHAQHPEDGDEEDEKQFFSMKIKTTFSWIEASRVNAGSNEWKAEKLATYKPPEIIAEHIQPKFRTKTRRTWLSEGKI